MSPFMSLTNLNLRRLESKEVSLRIKALSHPSRRYLLSLIYAYGPIMFSDFAKHLEQLKEYEVDVDMTRLPYHLNLLKNSGLIRNEYRSDRQGLKFSEYSISDEGLKFLAFLGMKEEIDKIRKSPVYH